MFVRYEKRKGEKITVLEGLEDKKGFIRKIIEFNEFEEKPTQIPEGFQKVNSERSWVLKYKYNPSRKPLQKDNEKYQEIKKKHSREKIYFTHDNGGRPFMVYISKERISAYKEVQKKFYCRDSDRDNENDLNNAWFYIDHVVTKTNFIKVWIGKSISNNTTKYLGSNTKEFLGNSILVKISPSRYMFIGDVVYEFSSDDEIKNFYAPVGNNDVPYSYAIGKEFVYFMSDRLRVPIKEFKKFTKEVQLNAYDAFYEDNLDTKGLKLQNFQEIQKRLW